MDLETGVDRGKKIKMLNPYQRGTDHVGDGRDHWAMCVRAGANWADWVVRVWSIGAKGMHSRMFSSAARDAAMSPDPEAPRVVARVNHNRWIADCECGGAEAVADGFPFFCFSCHNQRHGGRARLVQFPPDAAAIERALLKRPDILARNWLPTETLDDLHAQNSVLGKGR